MQIDLKGLEVSTTPQAPYPRSMRTCLHEPSFSVSTGVTTCADAIGQVAPGMNLHAVSIAEWSLHNVIAHLARQIAPCHLRIATWSISEDGLRAVLAERTAGRIASIRALFDWRVKVRNPDAVQFARAQCDKIRVASCHAKAALLRSDHYAITVLTSANLTGNPRIEVYNIIDNEAVHNFHARWIDHEIEHAEAFTGAHQPTARRR